MSKNYSADTLDLDAAALADLRSDISSAETQAENGPYYPERGVTRETLLAYAAKCRAKVERYSKGGAHAAVWCGESNHD
jgi:hypothetical protein